MSHLTANKYHKNREFKDLPKSTHEIFGLTPAKGTSAERWWVYPRVISSFKLRKGEWHYIEVHVDLGTPGQNNGVYEMWAMLGSTKRISVIS